MKKKLKSDLVSLAHKILKLDSESDYETLKNEAQKIYEALSVLAYIEASFDAGQPATDKAEIIKALEDENTEVIAESIQEIQQEQVEETPTEAPQKEETELERIARIAAANEELFERLRTPEEPKPKAEDPKPKEQKEPKINQASLHEPVMEKIKDIVAQMPPAGHAVSAMPANHVPLAAHQLADAEVTNVFAELNDFADELMPHHERHQDGFAGPVVPFVNVQIGAADAGATHLDEDVIGRHPGLRNVLEPKSFSGLFFNECLHLSCKKDFHVMGAEAPG